MRARSGVILSLLAAVTVAAPATAQVPGISLEVLPKIGAYVPGGSLAEVQANGEESMVELESDLAVGLAIEVGLPLIPVDLRAGFDYATGTTVNTEGFSTTSDSEATLLAGSVDLVLRPLPLPIVSPYILAGVGMKRYEFSTDDTDVNLEELLGEVEDEWGIHAGLGVDVGLGPLALTAEVSDYISWSSAGAGSENENEFQNDVFAMVGFRVGLF